MLRTHQKPLSGYALRDAQWLQSEPLLRQFELAVAGSSQKTLSLRAIKEVLISDPTTEEKGRLGEVFLALTSQSIEEMAFLTKLQKVKSGLMTDLLTGRVRVPESISAGDSQS